MTATTATRTAGRASQHGAGRAGGPVRLIAGVGPALPAARSGVAAVAYAGEVIVAGGLSDATVSTDTVFRLTAAGTVQTAGTLPGAAHDAAAAVSGGRILLFGGGVSEGSDRIEQVLPPPARVIGHLRLALSDLTATSIGATVYIAGGWDGTTTNPAIFALAPGQVAPVPVGSLPQGVRYPAVAALGDRLVVAGGELTSGNPTAAAWEFDPASGRTVPLPALPAPIDHGSAAALDGRFYLLGGLRAGTLSATILSWAPGETRWRVAGRLPQPLQNTAAAPYQGGIAVIGGKGASGAVADVTVLRPG